MNARTAAAAGACRRRITWRESLPRFLRGEIARHLAHNRGAPEIACRMGIHVSVALRIISELSKEKRLTGRDAKK